MDQACATILAAGLGRRMGGTAKAALQIDGVSVLERLAQALRGAGVEHISAVIGPYREQLLPLLERCRVQAVTHTLLEPSLIDSQRLALQCHHLQFPERDLLLVLGDLALLVEADVSALLAAWATRDQGVLAQVPVVDGVQGHPVLLSSQAIAQILAMAPQFGVRDWMREHAQALRRIPMSAQGCIRDLDTPDDLANLMSSVGR